MKYKGIYTLTFTHEVDALTEEEARKKLTNYLLDLAGSNDGSEMLANADFELEV